MKIVHVVPHIAAEASGPSYSVPRLCQAIASRGDEVVLSCLAAEHSIPGVRTEVYPSWPILRGFSVSHRHALALRQEACRADIIHNHSLWSMVNVATGWVVPGKHAKLVVSPRGTLSAWALAHSKQKKRLLWPLQRRLLLRANLLHATCEEEYADIRRLGLRAPVAIVSNGIDLPDLIPRAIDQNERTLLFLSRVHRVKGIEVLLDAWAALESRFPEWRLRIVGPGEPEYLAALHARAVRNGSRRVTFDGPLYGEDKAAAYRNADLFVLPTHSENFGMVVAEALAQECPAIVSHGAPWSGLDREGCGWWIPNDVDSLRATLEQAMVQPPEALHAMGARGRQWMQRDYSWSTVAEAMSAAYRWVIAGGTMPSCVRWGEKGM